MISLLCCSNTQQLALQIWHLSKVRTGWQNKWFGKFFEHFAKSPFLPCIPHRSRLFWLNSPDIMEFSSWKRFNNVVNAIICCAKEARALIVLIIEWVQFVLQNCENCIHFCPKYVSLLKKQRHIVLFTADVMYKKHKRLAYTSPDLLARFCKAKLAEHKKFGFILFQPPF